MEPSVFGVPAEYADYDHDHLPVNPPPPPPPPAHPSGPTGPTMTTITTTITTMTVPTTASTPAITPATTPTGTSMNSGATNQLPASPPLPLLSVPLSVPALSSSSSSSADAFDFYKKNQKPNQNQTDNKEQIMTAMVMEGGGEGGGIEGNEEGNDEEAVFRTSLDMDMLGEEVIDFDRCDESLLEWEASSRSKGSSSGDTFEEGETNHSNHHQTDHDNHHHNRIVGLSSTSLLQARTGEEQGPGLGQGSASGPGQGSRLGHGLSRDAHSLSSNSSDSALGLHAHRVITTRIHHPPNHSHGPGQSDSLSSSPFYFGDDDHGKTLLSSHSNHHHHHHHHHQQQQQQQQQRLNHTTSHHHDASTSSGSSPLLLSSSPCLLSGDVMIASGPGLATGPELDLDFLGGNDTDTHQHEHQHQHYHQDEREHQNEDENVSEGSTIDYNDQQDESSIDSTDQHHNHHDHDNAEASSRTHPGEAGGSTTPSSTLAFPITSATPSSAEEGTVSSKRTPGGKDGDNGGSIGGSSSHRRHSKESHSRTSRNRPTPSSSKPTKVNPDLLLLAPPAIIASTLALYPSNTSSLATPTPLSTTMTTTNHQGVHHSVTSGHASGKGGRIACGSTSKCQSDDCNICSLFRPRDLLGVLLISLTTPL